MPELEKALEEPERVGIAFNRYVSVINALTYVCN